MNARVKNVFRSISRRWWMALVALVLIPALALGLHQRLFFSLKVSWQEARADARQPTLPEYRVRVDALPIEGVTNNLSGLAYDDERALLWAVVNKPAELLALSKDGKLLARYPLNGFDDVEGIAYMGNDLLVLAEERRGALVIVPVPDKAGPLPRTGLRTLTLHIGQAKNRGFEGLDYDRRGDRLFVVQERSPRKLYEIRGIRASLGGQFNLEVIDREDWIGDEALAKDLSSVHYDEATGHLILLSDESRSIVELGTDGRLIDFHSLSRGFAGLDKLVRHAEGMSFDDQGDLYLVGEPNLFYAFARVRGVGGR